MKYIFWGSPKFAAIILEKLIGAGFVPEAVICNPDRPVGRKKEITPPPTKLVISHQKLDNRVKIFQPENLSLSMSDVSCLATDLFIVAAYAKIIPQQILDIPKLGVIGVHPSLLPKYRGASPIQSAILSGERKTGTTLYLMDAKMDHGKIVSSREYPVSNMETYESLMKKLAEISGDLLIEILPRFIKGEINPMPQNENEATHTKKFTAEDGFVDSVSLDEAQNGASLEKAVLIERKVRALNPEPGVWTLRQAPAEGEARRRRQGKPRRMKILEAELDADNKLILKKIQFEGKNPQTAVK